MSGGKCFGRGNTHSSRSPVFMHSVSFATTIVHSEVLFVHSRHISASSTFNSHGQARWPPCLQCLLRPQLCILKYFLCAFCAFKHISASSTFSWPGSLASMPVFLFHRTFCIPCSHFLQLFLCFFVMCYRLNCILHPINKLTHACNRN